MRANLRWWLWTSFTFAVIAVAALMGFFGVLLANDVTYLGISVLALYVVSSAWMFLKVKRGDADYEFVWYLADVMERVGILGTFVGLAIAFQALSTMDQNGAAFKAALFHGVLTKLYASICGITGAIFLKTQVKILET
jgi:xanthosine utilization system XapX-like protein